MYTTAVFEASIPVDEYLEKYVDIPTFRKACQQCPNYDKVWSCPSYDFDVTEYWKQYQTLQLTAVRIQFSEDMTARTYTQEELNDIFQNTLFVEKQKLSNILYEKEAAHPGSISLSAGSCGFCKNGCTRPDGLPCRFPEKMRYSIESLGGNVGLTLDRLMHQKLEWTQEGRLPSHFVLVCGLLLP